MGTFFIYILKVSLCQAMFWLMYRLLLSRDTYHTFNRFMLWVLQALAFTLPLCQTTTDAPSAVHQGFAAATAVILLQAETVSHVAQSLSLFQVFFLIYIIGVAVLASGSLISLVRILRLTHSGQCVSEEGGAHVTLHMAGHIAPFSWFRHIVICPTDNELDQRFILLHETAHVRLCHSLDTLANDLLTLLTWFNPFAWLLRRELSEVHEYEADAAVLRQGVDPSRYQMLLIRKTVGDHLFALANNFRNNSLKKRITMMNSPKTRPWLRFKAMLAFPLSLVVVAAFAHPKVAAVADHAAAESGQALHMLSEMTGTAEVRAAVQANQQTNLSPTSNTPSAEEMAKTSKNSELTPDSVVVIRTQRGTTGAFSTDKNPVYVIDGKLSTEDEMRKLAPSEIESVTVLPSNVAENLLGKKCPDGAMLIDTNHAPLFVVDGTPVEAEALFRIDVTSIESMTVVKNEDALKQWGEKGKNGVILIQTKKSAE